MIYKVENPNKYTDNLQDIKVKCPNCGHSFVIPVFLDTKICKHCNHKVHNNTKMYFDYKLKKMMKERNEMEYDLEELEGRTYHYGVMTKKYYKVINYDGNEEKLKEYVKKLNDDSLFNIDYYIHKIEGNEAIIEEIIDTLD